MEGLVAGGSAATEHPRPLLRRPWFSLDGEWEFAGEAQPSGLRWDEVSFSQTIQVPYAPETPASGVGWQGPLGRSWYRRRLPAAVPGRRILLHFGAVDRICDVWVGGAHVVRHEGGYTPFSVDVTEFLTTEAELVVRADDDPLDMEAPRGKQDWRDEPHFIWYPRTSGIWRTVWLEEVSALHIEELQWSTDPLSMTVRLRVYLSAAATGHHLRLRLRAGERVLVDDSFRVEGPVVERTMQVGDGGFDDRVELVWWPDPDRARLLDATLTLISPADEVLDEVESYTAIRRVEVEDGQLLINRRPTQLRLVLDQGYWPETGATPLDPEALRRDLELTRALGFNGARKHQKTEDPRYFAWADQMGMLAWVEMPSAYRPGPRTSERLLREWAEVVRAHRNHPSVIAWVPVNESWGVAELERNFQQRSLVRSLAAIADTLDGTRPISANDGWETGDGTILAAHDYDQDASALAARYRDREAVERAATTRRRDGLMLDLDRAGTAGRAVMLSEFGGISLAVPVDSTGLLDLLETTTAWGYGDAGGPEELLERYRALWAAVHSSEVLVGACWTQLTDTYQEQNGLLRMDRSPKLQIERVAAATRGEPPPPKALP